MATIHIRSADSADGRTLRPLTTHPGHSIGKAMFTTLFTSADVVASSLTGLALMSFAAAIICFLGLSWSNERWRIPEALVGTACLVTSLYYAGAAGYWYGSDAASAGVRFSAWYSVHPLQVVAVYFYARTQGPVPVGVFWRLGGQLIRFTLVTWCL